MDDMRLETLLSLDSKNNSECSRSTSEPNTSMVEDCGASRKKRKACTDLESARKRQRGPRQSNEIIRGTKTKSKSGRKSPKKKPTEVPVVEDGDGQLPATEPPRGTSTESGCDVSSSSSCLSASSDKSDFEDKYLELGRLGEGGFGLVYAGVRKTDGFPVAIKHMPKYKVETQPIVLNGETHQVPTEVLLMQRMAGGPETVGKSAAVSLFEWYDLEDEILLVMERPVPSVDLCTYLEDNNGPVEENLAKSIMKQLVEAAIHMHSEGVFHRDIKSENILLETDSDVPRVRVIDFGCGCFVRNSYCSYSGTHAYVPPEFCIQGRYDAGPTTVWQLGALLYELIDGHMLFDTVVFLRSPVRFMCQLRELNMSQDCMHLLRRCFTVHPQQRITLEQMLQHPWFK